MSHNNRNWEQQLARAGFRVTRQRSVVLDAVCDGSGHTTLSEISGRVRRADPTIDRSTVYRALRTFTSAGIVVAADTGDPEPYYEIARATPHHHLTCRGCGWEHEIPADDLSALTGTLLDRYGFQVATDHLVLFGLCDACRASAEPDERPANRGTGPDQNRSGPIAPSR